MKFTMRVLVEPTDGIPDDAEVQECPLEMTCPKLWLNLKQTEDPKMRFCSSCRKPVYFCSTQQELQDARQERCCVAYLAQEREFERVLLGIPRRTGGSTIS